MSVREYFDKCADRFDGFYREEKKGILEEAAHRAFRKPGLVRRFEATAKILGDVRGKTILDVGCGSGIYSIYFAGNGAKVTGLDFSDNMIALAGRNAAAEGCRAEFLRGDFLDFDAGRRFDHLLFIGVFDYVGEADIPAYLGKADAMANDAIVATFPKRYTPQTPIRYFWLKKQNCPVHFFTRRQVERFAEGIGRMAGFVDCGPIWTVAFRRRPA